MKTRLIIATVIYVTSFILGWYIVNAQGIFALELRLGFTNAFAWLHQPFNTILKAIIQFIFPWTLPQPHYMPPSQIPSLSSVQAMELHFIELSLIILIVLLYVFVATTLLGVVPLVGTVLVGFVAVVEGVGLGGRASSALGYLGFPPFAPESFLASIVPVLLILIAEILSSSAGFHIAFVLLRAKHGSRWSSFKGAWRDASRIYALVIILLAMAGIVELIGYIPF